MVDTNNFISNFSIQFEKYKDMLPWDMVKNLPGTLEEMIATLDKDYTITDNIAIHKNAVIEKGVTLKGPIIISDGCFIGANAYIRGPVLIDANVKIGPGCEIKQSIIFSNTAIAHFNYIGDSLIGSHVNFEDGSVAANHYNERADKVISVTFDGNIINTGCIKFGALVGDHSRIGANAVLSPGSILIKHSVVGRLQLVDQMSN